MRKELLMPQSKKLTKQDLAAITAAYNAGEDGTTIARRYGLHQATIYYHLRCLGVPARKRPGRWPAVPAAIVDALVNDYTTRNPDGSWTGTSTLERRYGVSDSVILLHLRKRGISIRDAKESHSGGKRCKPVRNLPPKHRPIPTCKCGCGAETKWNQRKNGWNTYIEGHQRPDRPYKHRDWLYQVYTVERQRLDDIAAACGVTSNAIVQAVKQFGFPKRVRPGCERLPVERQERTEIDRTNGANGDGRRRMPMCGPDNPAWRGGTTPERQRLYKQGHWQEFVKVVYARDNYTCRRCGARKAEPKSLHCHHLHPWADHAELRFDTDNCVTLCRSCHTWVHSKANVNREFLTEI